VASSSSFVATRVPGRPTTEPVRFLCSSAATGSRPSCRTIAPWLSDTATMRAPASAKRRNATPPTLPTPCTE
jgi:hypothetical protein